MAFEMFSIWEDKEFHIGWAILTPRGDTFQTFMKKMFLLKDILPVFLGKMIALVPDLSVHNQNPFELVAQIYREIEPILWIIFTLMFFLCVCALLSDLAHISKLTNKQL